MAEKNLTTMRMKECLTNLAMEMKTEVVHHLTRMAMLIEAAQRLTKT
jgi:hypothetical protein